MLSISLAFLSGVLLLQFFSCLPSTIWSMAAVAAAFFFYQRKWPCHMVMTAFLLGFAWCLWYANSIAAFVLPAAWENKVVSVQGRVVSLPRVSAYQTSFLFQLSGKENKKAIVRLTWRLPPQSIRVGDEWQLSVRLKRIHSTLNPGGFDYEAWAFQNGIRASGYVSPKEKAVLLSHANVSAFMNRMRQFIQEEAEKLLPHTKTSPWIVALMIGERNGIPPSEWEVLRNTGTNHLMAIAGLHLGFMSALAYACGAWIWRQFPRLLLLLPAHLAGASAALLMSLFYSVLAGFSIPTQRALIMISIYLIATVNKRVLPSWHAFGLALLLVLLFNPLSVLSSSFWLSFSTIALILYAMGGRLGGQGLWWHWGRPQWVIALGLLPLSVWIFTQYSCVSFLANALAIPWVGFLVLPFCFLAVILLGICPMLAKWPLIVADKSLSTLWIFLTWFSHLSFASWYHAIPHYGYVVSAVIAVVLLLLPAGFPGKLLGIAWLLPLFFFKPFTPGYGEAAFSLLDVGQGLSAIVQTQNHALIFDAGARFSADHDMGESVIIPFIRGQGIRQLDMMVISHGDNDHRGGAEAILRQIPVLSLYTSVPLLFPSRQAGYCLAGMSWSWDGVNFSFLSPTEIQLNRGNNSSCVLRVTTAQGSVLLPGDIELEAERALVERSGEGLRADILVAPHHGSKTSGLREFISLVHPQYVLYAIGYHNRYHFPHEPIRETYQHWGVMQYDTVSAGAIQFTLGRDSHLIPRLYRQKVRRYWNN